MNKREGIRDLMKEKRFSIIHVQEALKEHNVPGNWEAYQNVYNFVSGKIPRDCYAFIVVAQLLDVNLQEILMRYSSVKDEVKNVINKREIEQELNW